MSAQNCAIILLASGLSKRFGAENKLLAKLGGRTVIESTIDRAASVQFGLRVAVIGHNIADYEVLQTKLSQTGYMTIVNSLPKAGQGGSLALGVRAVISAGYERACISLADMPFVPSHHFTALLELSRKSEQVITETNIDGKAVILPPCIFSGQGLLRLLKAREDKGAKAYFKPKEFSRLPLSPLSAQDIDTQEDLHNAEHHLSLLKLSEQRRQAYQISQDKE